MTSFRTLQSPSPSRASTRPTRSPSRSTTATGWSWGRGWRTTSDRACASGTRSPGRAPTCSARHARPAVARRRAGDAMDAARGEDGDAAFEFFTKLGVPYYCFHDRDVAPEGPVTRNSARTSTRWSTMSRATGADRCAAAVGHGQPVRPPALPAGAATNPDPEVFAYAAAQVKHMLEADPAPGRPELRAVGRPRGLRHAAQHRSPARGRQLARFLHLVAEHKHKIGFEGQLLIEPKPMEPTKHQYDYDVATVARLPRPERARWRVQTSTSRRTTPRSPATASITRSPTRPRTACSAASMRIAATPQNGWDTDQFPNSVDELALPMYEILRAGGFATGGFNFDAKLRRQSIAPERPVPCAHRRASTRSRRPCSWPPTWSRGRAGRAARRAVRGLGRGLGARSWTGRSILAALEERVAGEHGSAPVSGGQERLENLVNRGSGGRRSAGPRARREATHDTSSGSTFRRPPRRPSLVDGTARSPGSASPSTASTCPQPLWSEQDPRLWWDAAIAAIRAVLASTGVAAADDRVASA